MIARLHFATTLFLSFIIFYHILSYNFLDSIFLSIITSLLSTLPDMDYKISKNIENQIKFLKSTKLNIILFPYYLFIKFLYIIFKHRGFTHSIYPIIIFLLLSENIIFFILFLSFSLHIIEDSLTVSGIKPFYPFGPTIALKILNNKERKIQDFLSYIILFTFIIYLTYIIS